MRRSFLLVVALLAAFAACSSGDGSPATTASGDTRTIQVEMRDIAFSPATVDVRAGEKVRFVFMNRGQIPHDAFIGDAAAQDQHERDMRGDMGNHEAGSNAVSVKPGKSAQLSYTFDRPGQILLGCHQPGHYTGGMRLTVNVA